MCIHINLVVSIQDLVREPLKHLFYTYELTVPLF